MALTFNDNPPKKILYNNQDVLKIKYNNDIVWEKSPPAEYRQVEYLQSSGSQYIDLGRVPNNDDIIEEKIQSLHSGSGTVAWYGSMPSSSTTVPRFGMGITGGKKFVGVNTTAYISGDATALTEIKWWASAEKRVTYIQDGDSPVVATSTFPKTATAYSPEVQLTSYLFARHGTNGVQTYDGTGTKIYYHREYLADGTIAMSLVPCYRIADNKPGMYDLVSDTFLINQGSGEFTYPS